MARGCREAGGSKDGARLGGFVLFFWIGGNTADVCLAWGRNVVYGAVGEKSCKFG